MGSQNEPGPAALIWLSILRPTHGLKMGDDGAHQSA